jgi:hypothetical protein
MIVSEEHMHAVVAVLNDFDGTAEFSYRANVAENAAKEIFARLYLSYTGSIDERKARATVHPEYAEAKAKEAEALRDLERRKAELKSAENLREIWQTESFNARAAERIR